MSRPNNISTRASLGPELSDATFLKIKSLVEPLIGIQLPLRKKGLVQSRLSKRLKELNLTTYEHYYRLLSEYGDEAEKNELLNLLTTNTTYFFREPDHFGFLENQVLPDVLKRKKIAPLSESVYQKPIRIWCSACSRGHEAYTIAMLVDRYLRSHGYKNDFKVIASDISTKVLNHGRKAIYMPEEVQSIPHSYLREYFMRSIDSTKDCYRIIPDIRSRVEFQRINLINQQEWPEQEMDIIFCRNVLIYFNKESQAKIIENFAGQLLPKGYLFLGHSESIQGLKVPFRSVFATTYQRKY